MGFGGLCIEYPPSTVSSLQDSIKFLSSRDAQCAAGKEYSFAIYSLKDEALLGSVGLSRVDPVHRFANLGYWVRSGRTRQGIRTAAVRLAARFAFEQLGLNRLELIVPAGNWFSIRVAEKAGGNLDAILKRRLMVRGHPHDAVCYSLIAPARLA